MLSVGVASPARALDTSDTSEVLEFGFSGAPEHWTVPEGVTHVDITTQGAGGYFDSDSDGGFGARVEGTIPVTPGDEFTLVVGGAGELSVGGFNGGGDGGEGLRPGGGGGGATSVAVNGELVQIAGGGGGQSYSGGQFSRNNGAGAVATRYTHPGGSASLLGEAGVDGDGPSWLPPAAGLDAYPEALRGRAGGSGGGGGLGGAAGQPDETLPTWGAGIAGTSGTAATGTQVGVGGNGAALEVAGDTNIANAGGGGGGGAMGGGGGGTGAVHPTGNTVGLTASVAGSGGGGSSLGPAGAIFSTANARTSGLVEIRYTQETGGEEPGEEPGTNPGEEPGTEPGEAPSEEPSGNPGGQPAGTEPPAANLPVDGQRSAAATHAAPRALAATGGSAHAPWAAVAGTLVLAGALSVLWARRGRGSGDRA